ncbi:two-component sensor histidine kinase [Paenibacillus tyrfis]|uniref:sensor histidine kinase n=1 Tax=Paenibacillus tyrfis TaxID=1501230 RepID=UPI0024926A30|nr:histidine kinase dimerization/phospho-acceptor domain-containing protein [Paenibacillus tyrfis]GLI04775.1 two-component sensor histidine kinase [Paenibacillus tyrfis]
MATKSRSKLVPWLAWGLLSYLIALGLLAASDVLKNQEYLQKDYYFRSPAFYEQLQQHFNLFRNVHVVYNHWEDKTDAEKIGQARMEQWTRHFETVKNIEVEQRKAEVQHQILNLQTLLGDVVAIAKEKREQAANSAEESGAEQAKAQSQDAQNPPDAEEQAEIARIRKEIALLQDTEANILPNAERQKNERIEKEIKNYLDFHNKQYAAVKHSLSARSGSFQYYVKDLETGEIYANRDRDPYTGEETAAFYAIRLPQTTLEGGALQSINRSFQQYRLEGIFLFPKEPRGFSQMIADHAYFNTLRERLIYELYLLGAVVAAAAALIFYLRRNRFGIEVVQQNYTAVIRGIPLELRLLLFYVLTMFALSYGSSAALFRLPVGPSHFAQLTLLALLIGCLGLLLSDAVLLLRNPLALREQWNAGLYRKLERYFRDALIHRNILFKAGLIFVLTLLFGVLLITAVDYMMNNRFRGNFSPFLWSAGYVLFYSFVVVPYLLRRIRQLVRILTGAEAIASGRFDHTIVEKGRGNLARLAHLLNNIKQSIKTSVERETKSERLKSELITNVSHDLKTPLTSIMNYVDLLKRRDLSPETVASYVEVLDRKTQRLKVLIDDLFEASKMASGSVELAVEHVNVADLLQQALAEFSDKIEASTLTFRVRVDNPKVTAPLDGRKTWRVFENLISNALKYAMPHTRVHLALTEEADKVVFTINNVAAYELNFDVDEIFERFKRGDTSRNTEGSGLGLAIAKSIVELQGGQLRIDIDGDYFKVRVEFAREVKAAAS